MPSDTTGNKNKIQYWKSCFSTIVNERSKMVHVSFKHAPPAFGFVDYFVSLNNHFTKRNVCRNETKTTSFNFTDLDYGTYNVIVYPSDPNNLCGGPCSRSKSDAFSIGKNGTSLLNLTMCGNNTRTQVTPLEMIIKPTAPENTWKFYFLLLPLLFMIMALILYAIMLSFDASPTEDCYKWKRSLNNVNELVISDLTTTSTATPTTTTTSSGKVKVFIVYTDDHLFHTEACLSFIRYLNEHCFCDVLNTYPEYSSVPAYNMDKYSDFVLVINSKGFHKGFCAWKCSGSDFIVKSLELYEKILKNSNHSPSSGACEYLMCAMDYTDTSFIPVEFRRCKLFRIINDMTALVCYMQNLDLSSIHENDIPRVLEHIHLSPDGNALITAIENAENFEMTHPNCSQGN